MRASDYGTAQAGRKKYKRNYEKSLKQGAPYGMIINRDILSETRQKRLSLLLNDSGARDHKEVRNT